MSEDQKVVWVVMRYWPSGGSSPKFMSAHLTEDAARFAASKLVGQDGALVGLMTIPLEPPV